MSLTGHRNKLCNTFSKFSSDKDDELKESFAGLLPSTGGFADSAANVVQETKRRAPLSVSGAHSAITILGPF